MTQTDPSQREQAQSATLTKQQRQLLNSRMIAAQFGNIVTILMQSPGHRNFQLIDLYKRVVPPLLANQFRLAEAVKKETGTSLPVGLIMWARVSDEVHQRLYQDPSRSIDLDAKEWNSGDNYWIVDAIGPERFVAPLLNDLRQKEFNGKIVHFRARSSTGPEIRTLGQPAPSSAASDNDVPAATGTDGLNGQQATR